jgi:hypothetical protein
MSEQKQTDEAREKERRELRRRMAIQRQVELAMNGLIQGVVRLVDEQSKVAEAKGGMEKHQLKNLLDVALETPGVEVVKHYILYQVGRDAAGTSWRYNNFGKELVKALDGLKKNAERITRQVHDDLRLPEPEPGQEQIDETWMLLVRAYLGQLNRYFYYRKEETRWPPATS